MLDEGSLLKPRFFWGGGGRRLFPGVDVMSLRATYSERETNGGREVQERKIWKRQEGIKEVEYMKV